MQIDRLAAAGFSDALMAEFSSFVAQRVGLHFPRERWPDLSRAMTAIARDLDTGGGTGAAAGIRFVMNGVSTRDASELLARHLSVGETYFFRDSAVFDALEHKVLPALIAARRKSGKRLRIWSAGCCTGEELYSMAILLDRTIPDLADWKLTLLGTDINPGFLQKAKLGVYRDWSFRNVPAWIRQRYFRTDEHGSHAIVPELRQRVTFDYLNLATDPYPGHGNDALAMDIVLCRNVLMYFEPGLARQVIDKLHGALAADGWLAVSPSEAGGHVYPRFERMKFPDATLYRKQGATMPAAPDVVRVMVDPGMPSSNAGGRDERPDAACPEPPATPATLAAQARRCADLGLLTEADRLCRTAIAADKCDPALRYLLAVVLEEQGRFDDATEALNQALYLDPSFVLAHFTLGSLCRRQHKDGDADRHFANAFALLHRHAPADVLNESDGVSAGHLYNAMRIDRRTT
jgi:chemotaxis protein methyltransferase CheR